MCGRYGLFRDPAPLARALRARLPRGLSTVPRYNVAPQQPVLGIPNEPDPEVAEMRWGLLGADRADGRSRLSTINARIETLATSPLYGPLLPAQRCVLFADGYYEWQARRDGSKQPLWIERRDGTTFVFAGLWDRVFDGTQTAIACTIVTQPANPVLAVLHERMPVVLSLERAGRWLAAARMDPDEALALLPPADGAEWHYHAISAAVGNVKNDGPQLIAVAAPIPEAPSLFD